MARATYSKLFSAVGAEGAGLVGGADGGEDAGALVGDELEVEAHGGEGEQEVGEDDGGVDAEALGGGDGDLGGELGCAADVEQGVAAADGAVLRHVAAGLAEEPDGGAVDGEAEAGAKETAATRGGSRFRLENRGGGRGLSRRVRCPIGCNGVSVWGRRSMLCIESSGPGQRRSFDAIGPWGGGCTVQRFVLKLTQRVWSPNSSSVASSGGPGVNLLCAEWH